MVTICSLVVLMLSACLVTARPGAGDMAEMMCSMTVGGCGSAFMSADFTSVEGIAAVCSTTRPRFLACIENVPAECTAAVNTPEMGMMRTQLDTLCGAGRMQYA
ncbi:uncharacterized protein LOC110451384 isoform X2 [Mizuhopecten yessoensis]|uniref:uncharacterized protein LOC110451384 isoform X2 n=1 Tax=Mizuhopecten yessoensis TaxID=6573 RepID=UPI000B45ADF2|nr:uncharacterized protein LOC110451384 isoform X2 [Mizuhopecten yessoensis]